MLEENNATSIDTQDRKNMRDKSASAGSTESSSAVRKAESSKSSERNSDDQDQIVQLPQKITEHDKYVERATKFKHYRDLTDDFKSDAAYVKYGGFALRDKELLGRLRSSGTEVIKMVGKKIFSGKFNLTQISFPIKCMQAKSIIQCIPMIQSVNSYYLNYAASVKDPLERFKVVMTCTMALI